MSKDNKGGFKKTASGWGFQRGLIKKTKFDIKKNLTDYNYHLGSATQAADYETTTEFIVNYIKTTFDYGDDIGTALKTLYLLIKIGGKFPWDSVSLKIHSQEIKKTSSMKWNSVQIMKSIKGESIVIVMTLSKPMQRFGKGILRVWSRR
jgi:hypothetical protein